MWDKEEKLICHVVMVVKVSTNRGPRNMVPKPKKMTCFYDFPVYDCTQEQNVSPYLSSIVVDNASC